MAIFLAGKAVCYRILAFFLLGKVALQMRIRSAMYFSIIVDDGVGLLIADTGFLVDDGRSVFYADAVGHFASNP